MSDKSIIPFVSGLNADETQEWLDKLNEALPEYCIKPQQDCCIESLQSTEIAIVANPDPALLMQMPKLQWVQSLWAGVEHLVKQLPANIDIVRMEDPDLARAMSEAVLTWCLYLHRHMHLYVRQQKQKYWKQYPVVSASEINIGILGLGKLGVAASESLSNQGFVVSGWSRSNKSLPGIQTYVGDQGLKALLAKVDILVLLLPLTDSTRYLFNHQMLSSMKKGIIDLSDTITSPALNYCSPCRSSVKAKRMSSDCSKKHAISK